MKRFVVLAVASIGVTLAGCSNQYIERKDTVALSAGDAVATNIAVQTHDPWPKRSSDDRIPMDGVKAASALARYRSGGVGAAAPAPAGFGAPAYSAPVAGAH